MDDGERIIYLGVADRRLVAGAEATQQQGAQVRMLECPLTSADGRRLGWSSPELANRLQRVLDDRRQRENRLRTRGLPPVVAVTALGRRAARFEFYEGKMTLALTYEAREAGLWPAKLPGSVAPDFWPGNAALS